MACSCRRTGSVLAASLLILAGTVMTGASAGRPYHRGPSGAPVTRPYRGEPAPLQVANATRDTRLDWWREARFGLFVHFGLYSVLAGEWDGRTDYGEWIRHNAKIPLGVYDGLRARFNPTGFDASSWVRQAKRAGMRYMVITTKHHDGFALFDSRQTDFTVMSTPFKRDIVREVVDACRREGMRIGFYYSIMDWHHPDYLPRRDWEKDRPAEGAAFDRYVAFMKAQLRELLTNYGPIDILWFDGQWESTWTNDRGVDLFRYVRTLQPQIVVNNRVGRAGGSVGMDRESGAIGDFGTPEQEIPATGIAGLDWETCMTMNRNWGYNRADKDFKPAEDLLRKLVDIASKGGNFLLNVGPTAEGRFPQESVERLEQIGKWMDVNAESIRGTQAGPFDPLPWGRATQRRMPGEVTRLYLHVFDWPPNGRLSVGGLFNLPRKAFLLADGSEKEFETNREGDDLVLGVPPAPPDKVDGVVVLEVAGQPDINRAPSLWAPADVFLDTLPVSVFLDRRNVTLRYTTDSKPPTELSPAVEGPVVLNSTAAVTVQAFRNGRPIGPPVARTFRKVTPRPPAAVTDVVPGLRFECVEGEFKELPDFNRAAPKASGEAPAFNLSVRTRESQFALRFRGFVRIPTAGVYRFFLRSDDGSRMLVDESMAVANDGLHGSRELSGDVALAPGLHAITVEMFDGGGSSELAVSYMGPGITRQEIPPGVLFRAR